MADSRLPDEVRALVCDHLSSMAHLEALLLLSSQPEASLPASAVGAQINVDADAAGRALADLERSGLVADHAGAYRFAPADDGRRRAAGALAEMYRRFPVQVIRAVYERPPSPVQQLADAFRLRK